MAESMRNNLPLMKILIELPPHKQQIVLDHLDATSCSSVTKCIEKVLKNGKKFKGLHNVKHTVRKNKKSLELLLSKKGTFKQKRRRLAQFGGGVLSTLLAVGLPFLLDTIVSAVTPSRPAVKNN